MSKLRSILVPVDGSANSRRAFEYALTRGRDAARLVVMNVQPPMPPSRLVTRAMIAAHQEREARAALVAVRRAAKKHRVDVDWQVRIGSPAATIARVARDAGCGEIVMGTRGLGRLPGFLLGSTAMRVVQLADVPVTLVK